MGAWRKQALLWPRPSSALQMPAPPAAPPAPPTARRSKKWQSSLVLQPLAYAAMGAFKVHQFCGGLNAACTALFDALQEITVHHARMMDHHWLRNTKWA